MFVIKPTAHPNPFSAIKEIDRLAFSKNLNSLQFEDANGNHITLRPHDLEVFGGFVEGPNNADRLSYLPTDYERYTISIDTVTSADLDAIEQWTIGFVSITMEYWPSEELMPRLRAIQELHGHSVFSVSR